MSVHTGGWGRPPCIVRAWTWGPEATSEHPAQFWASPGFCGQGPRPEAQGCWGAPGWGGGGGVRGCGQKVALRERPLSRPRPPPEPRACGRVWKQSLQGDSVEDRPGSRGTYIQWLEGVCARGRRHRVDRGRWDRDCSDAATAKKGTGWRAQEGVPPEPSERRWPHHFSDFELMVSRTLRGRVSDVLGHRVCGRLLW